MKRILTCWLAILTLSLVAASPVIPVWDLGNEEPHFFLTNYDIHQRKASYEPMPDGRKALKIDLTRAVRDDFGGRFRAYRYLPDFTLATLTLQYYVPPKCGISSVWIVLCDRYNEQFPLRFDPQTAPGWHTKSFELDARKIQSGAWDTGIKSGFGDQRRSEGRLNFFDQPMRVIGIDGVCQVGKKENANWIAFGPITLEVKSSQQAIRPRLETGTSVHVLQKGDEQKLALSFFNPEPEAYRGSARVTVSDAAGKTLENKEFKLDIAAGETANCALAVPGKYGVYTVETTSRAAGKKDCVVKQSFCYMDPAGATPGVRPQGFLFGICSHFADWRIDAETEAAAAALCGVKIIREHSCWVGSNYDQSLPLSRVYNGDPLEPFEQLGIEYQPVLQYTPQWAVNKNVKPVWPEKTNYINYCPDFDAWRQYCRTYFTNNKGRIRFYEVWNEPEIDFANFPWDAYIQLQRIAYEELKKIDPAAKLLTAGYATDPVHSTCDPKIFTDPDHMRKTLRDRRSYDILAFHGHSLYPQYRGQLDNVVKAIRELAPDKPLYVNECGVTTTMTDEFQQGVNLFKKLLYTWANGGIGYNWYDLRNDGFDPTYTEHNFGMLTHDFYPKVVYAVFNTLAKRLTDAKFIAPLSSEPEIEGYLFRAANGDLYYAFWGWRNYDLPFILNQVTGKASLVDLFGNETPLAVHDGHVILPVDGNGQFLRLAGATSLPVLGGVLVAPERLPLLAEAGKTTVSKLAFRNPTDQPARFAWQLVAPAGITLSPAEASFDLKSGEKRDVSLTVSAPAGAAPEKLAGIIELKASFNGNAFAPVELPVVPVWNSVLKNVRPEQPQFRLHQAGNMFQLDMSPESLWQGPRDISAEVWLTRYEETFHVTIDVTDDVFCQPHTGFDGFKGDNVQIFFQIPGQSGLWEFGLSKTPAGDDLYCYSAPRGLTKFTDAQVRISPLTNGLRYEIWFPLHKLGLSERTGESGFRFNCYVNDNDGKCRKCYLGMCLSKEWEHFPMVFFR